MEINIRSIQQRHRCLPIVNLHLKDLLMEFDVTFLHLERTFGDFSDCLRRLGEAMPGGAEKRKRGGFWMFLASETQQFSANVAEEQRNSLLLNETCV